MPYSGELHADRRASMLTGFESRPDTKDPHGIKFSILRSKYQTRPFTDSTGAKSETNSVVPSGAVKRRMAKISYAEGFIQHSPGSRTERAHPGWTENINSNPDRVAQLSIHRNTDGILLWNPFRVRPIATNASPGWRGFAADPGLCCVTPLGYSIRGNQSFLGKLGTTEIPSTNAKRLSNKLGLGHLRLGFVICFEFRTSNFGFPNSWKSGSYYHGGPKCRHLMPSKR